MSTNEITGDTLVSKSVSDTYRSNWDLIFGKKDVKPVVQPEVKPKEPVLQPKINWVIISNSGYCAVCHEELRSYNRHDFKTCKCGASSIDGGMTYQRGLGSLVDTSVVLENTAENLKEQHDLIRQNFCWGSRGILGNQPLKYITLKDMQTDHIEAILSTQWHIKSTTTENIFQNELGYREVLYAIKNK